MTYQHWLTNLEMVTQTVTTGELNNDEILGGVLIVMLCKIQCKVYSFNGLFSLLGLNMKSMVERDTEKCYK